MTIAEAPTKDRKIVIVGDGAFAEIACEYFTYDSRYEVVAFAVERAFLKRDLLLGRPVAPFEEIATRFPAESHEVYVAIVYTQLNRLRTRLLSAAKRLGYTPASYISPRAFVWRNVQIGEHCFIFENCTLQPFVTVGDNVVIWSANHVGHHSRIGENVFIAGHVAVAGFCEVGANTFLGGNVIIGNHLTVGRDCWIGPGAVISRNTNDGELYTAAKSEVSKVSARRFFRIKD
jgi:sugar O-acyltransferase (sialic acid O-acetyltransferase NeuD family)